MPVSHHYGDCFYILDTFSDQMFDSVVTNPPCGTLIWQKVLRVLKPGGHLISFANTVAYHRMVVAIEDAGFEIRDQIQWLSSDVWKSIVLARKPLIGTVAENVLRYGVGGLNINECRVQTSDDLNGGAYAKNGTERYDGDENWRYRRTGRSSLNGDIGAVNNDFIQPEGRWPANVIHDGSDQIMDAFAAYGNRGASAPVQGHETSTTGQNGIYGHFERVPGTFYSDNGSAARFFHCAESSEQDLNLVRYLCKLVTPTGGTILDPYANFTIGQAVMDAEFNAVLISASW